MGPRPHCTRIEPSRSSPPDRGWRIAEFGSRFGKGNDGIVLDGFGLGNTSETLSDVVGDAIDGGIPVVVTSRVHAGTLEAVYGDGGGETLQRHGAISGGDLSAHKARIKLLLALETTTDTEALREYFDPW